jgi:Adenylate and Guanylate cyclase catalytic domain
MSLIFFTLSHFLRFCSIVFASAARMESTGIRDKVQLSQSTTDALIAAGKMHWTTQRETMIEAKGKGSMQTFWLNIGTKKAMSASSGGDAISDQQNIDLDRIDTSNPSSDEQKSASLLNVHYDKHDRLVDWMVDILLERLKPMVRFYKFVVVLLKIEPKFAKHMFVFVSSLICCYPFKYTH